jgi:CsoR family transcriptional regulator, copper-sensing transcriptional repressor
MTKSRARVTSTQPHVDAASGRRAILMRLRRIEGQLRAIQTLVESGAECEQVAQQMAASRAALDRAFFAMVSCAIDEVITEGGSAEQLSKRLAEVNGVLMRFG